jgi:hypothetical protein
MATMLLMMVVFFAGVAPDVLRHEGQNWVNEAAKQEITRGQAAATQHDDQHAPGGEGGAVHQQAPSAH